MANHIWGYNKLAKVREDTPVLGHQNNIVHTPTPFYNVLWGEDPTVFGHVNNLSHLLLFDNYLRTPLFFRMRDGAIWLATNVPRRKCDLLQCDLIQMSLAAM